MRCPPFGDTDSQVHVPTTTKTNTTSRDDKGHSIDSLQPRVANTECSSYTWPKACSGDPNQFRETDRPPDWLSKREGSRIQWISQSPAPVVLTSESFREAAGQKWYPPGITTPPERIRKLVGEGIHVKGFHFVRISILPLSCPPFRRVEKKEKKGPSPSGVV